MWKLLLVVDYEIDSAFEGKLPFLSTKYVVIWFHLVVYTLYQEVYILETKVKKLKNSALQMYTYTSSPCGNYRV